MYQFEVRDSLFGQEVTAWVLVLTQGIHVSLFGGDLPHIGAVSIIGLKGDVHTEQFPGHKEGIISDTWARGLSKSGYAPVVVEVGIHYDQLGQEGIEQVCQLAEHMLRKVIDGLPAVWQVGN